MNVIKNIIPIEDEIIGFIIGNKEDLVNKRKINPEEPVILAKQLNLKYIEISALTGKNVEEIFFNLAETLINTRE